MIKKLIMAAAACFCLNSAFAQTDTTSATSSIDWSTSKFSSLIDLDLNKAGISNPSSRGSAVELINMQLPTLIKDKMLSIQVDSSMQLSDLVIQGSVTLEQLTDIIDNSSYKSSCYFSRDFKNLEVVHNFSLNDVGSLIIKHNTAYRPKNPIDKVPSRAYSGIIIDARGNLPVHGEFTRDDLDPCLFPKIWDDTMELLYERNMVNPNIGKKQGIVTYTYSTNEKDYASRIGNDPLRISAKQVYGITRTDPIISRNDALKILSVPANVKLLEEGKVVIIIDKGKIKHDVIVPVKDASYWNLIEEIVQADLPDDIGLSQGPDGGVKLEMQELKFEPNLPILLPSETPRLDKVADLLKDAIKHNGYTISISGHTADIGNTEEQYRLSVERAKTIATEMIKRGVPENKITYNGFGGTKPVDTNSTDAGRAKNRRVEIIIKPPYGTTTMMPY